MNRRSLPLIDPRFRARQDAPASVECRKLEIAITRFGDWITERQNTRQSPTKFLAGTGASQTWRTFLANHYRQLTFISPESPTQGSNDVVNGDDLTSRHTPLLPNPSYRSHQRAVVACDASLRQTSSAMHLVHHHLHDRPIRTSSARSPPGTGRSLARSTANAESIDAPSRTDLRMTTRCRSSGPGGMRSHHAMTT
jgi:hypothetical protein